MGLKGFSGSGGEARVWRLASANAGGQPTVLRLADGGGSAGERPPDVSHPHLLSVGQRVRANPAFTATVMPLLAEGTLAERLVAVGPLPSSQTLGVAVGIREALLELHQVGFVHLDVCPNNIMLSADGCPTLIDVDGAVPADGQPARRGTPPYTVPGVDASPATDWVALGRVIVELASGSPTTDPQRLSGSLRPVVVHLLNGEDPGDLLPDLSADQRRLPLYPVGHITPPDERPTIDFPTSTTEAVSPKKRQAARFVVAIGVLLTTLAAAAAALSIAPTDHSAGCAESDEPDGLAPTYERIDVDTGQRCVTPVLWSKETGVLIVPTSEGQQHFAIGLPGDRLSFGDWNCDGTITPAITRGERFYVFANWPQQSPVAAHETSPTSIDRPVCTSSTRRDG